MNAIVSVIQEDNPRAKTQGYEFSQKAWKKWADLNQADYLTDGSWRKYNDVAPQFKKYDIENLLLKYDNILVVDADTIPHPTLFGDIFNLVPDNKIMASVLNFGSLEWVNRTLEITNEEMQFYCKFNTDKYINTGVMLFSKRSVPLIQDFCSYIQKNHNRSIEISKKYKMGIDQTLFNLYLSRHNLTNQVELLPWTFNIQDLKMRQCLSSHDLFWLDMGYIFHFNGGIEPSPGVLLEQVYNKLWPES